MMPPRILIIGCGISGPAIAILLKNKGYHPVIFEKSSESGDLGASLMISPNGMKVLDVIGVASKLFDQGPALSEIVEKTGKGEALGYSTLPSDYKTLYGQPAKGVKRTVIMALMKEAAANHGIEIRTGYAFESIREEVDGVVAVFEGGREEKGAFLVGSDGIRAISRRIVLQRHGVEDTSPVYTGITQTAGLSPTPEALKGSAAMRNWYGQGVHFICYPLTTSTTSWAITQAEADEKASWGLYDDERRVIAKKEFATLLEGWDPVVRELSTTLTRLIKYGIYDRPGLSSSQLYSGRCVLIGDAAHPTSVHLGQGANLSLEDCFQLSKVLPDVSSGDGEVTLATLTDAFQSYSEIQQPRTAQLVQASRKQGELRVVTDGPEACKQRDDTVRSVWADIAAVRNRFDAMYQAPF